MELASRRGFIGMAAAAVAAAAARGAEPVRKDPNLSVFFSDVHISGKNVKGQPTYQNPLLDKAVDAVLAMNPRPARVLVFGDVALWNGLTADYEEAAPRLARLAAAGIEVFATTGNHDHRDPFFRFFPKQKEITPVPGRTVSVIDCGTSDFVLLDSLKANPKGEGSPSPVPGELDAAQGEWLLDFAKNAKRPFLCGAHHPAQELSVRGEKFMKALKKFPHFSGYVHGHNHRWYKEREYEGWRSQAILRMACLPSTGWWGDIGFGVYRTGGKTAELAVRQSDFFFPRPLNPRESRPAEWDCIVRDNSGAKCTFAYRG